jgi:hypothetical protein
MISGMLINKPVYANDGHGRLIAEY